MKAQSAIEYLTTYGWMLVAVSIATGTVYTTMNDACVESTSGFVDTSLGVGDFGINTDNELSILVQNRRGEEIHVDKVKVGDSGELDIDQNISPGREGSIEIEGFETTESCNEIDLAFVYSIDDLNNQKISGTLTGPYALGGEPPSSPQNLTANFTG